MDPCLKRSMQLVGLLIPLTLVGAKGANRSSQTDDGQPAADSDDRSPVEHGKYIVHHVSMCIYCHSPREEDGTPDREQLLTGATMPVASPFDGQQWAFRAPAIAGLPGGWSEAQVAQFLQTGESAREHSVRPPMPPFRMNERDARAVAAYLKSLGSSQPAR